MHTARESLFLAMANDGLWSNQDSGDIECPTGYFSRIYVPESDLEYTRLYFTDIVAGLDTVKDSEIIGSYIVYQNSDGSVDIIEHDNYSSACYAFADLDAAYHAWLSDAYL